MMDLTPRQRVLAALNHEPVAQTPFAWGFGPTPEMTTTLRRDLAEQGVDWDRLRLATDDIRAVSPRYSGTLPPGVDSFTGIWGIRVVDVEYTGGSYQEFTDFPLAQFTSPHEFDRHPWPDPDFYDYADLRRQITQDNPHQYRATRFFAANPFEIYCWLTGLEQAMLNAVDHPALVHGALERITGFYERRLARVLQVAGDLIDLVFMADDVGGQHGPLLSNAMYRELLQPYHRRLIDVVRELAPHARVMYHSDGGVFELLPDLLDAGIDVLEAVQVEAAGMDPVNLKKTFGRRLSFHGAISVQQVLPRLSADEVCRVCRQLIAVLGEGGGYIAAPSHAVQVGTPPQNVIAMLEAVLGPERLAAAWRSAAIAPSSAAAPRR